MSAGTNTEPSTPTGEGTATEGVVDPLCAVPVPSWPSPHSSSPFQTMLNDTCTFEGSEAVGEGLRILLDCPMIETDPDEFVITGGPLPALPAIGAVIDLTLDYANFALDTSEQVVILRSEGALLYASVNAMYADAAFAGQTVFAPLQLDRVELCALKTSAAFDTDDGPDTGDFFACMKDGQAQLKVSAAGSDDLLLLEGEAGMIAAGEATYAVDVRQIWRAEDCNLDPGALITVAGFAIAAQ